MLLVCVKIGGFIWLSHYLRQDEVQLDYSRMDVRKGVADASINGYTLMREFSDAYDVEFDEVLDELVYQPREQWDVTVMREQIETHRELLDTFSEAFGRPEFYFDQEMRPDLLVPELGMWRYYVRLRILESRLEYKEGRSVQALSILLRTNAELVEYGQSGGGLLSGLTSVAQRNVLYVEMRELLVATEFSSAYLIRVVEDMPKLPSYRSMFEVNFKHEFHMTTYCVDMISDDPYEAYQNMTLLDEGGRSSSVLTGIKRVFYKVGIRHSLNVDATKNLAYNLYSEILDGLLLPASERQFELFWEERNAGLDFSERNPVGRGLLMILVPAATAVVETVDLAEIQQNALMLSFALKAYHQDHGELPEQLSDLVSNYIAEVPTDPFDGKPMRYSKAKAIIYSVGNNYIDSGGSELPFEYELGEDDDGGSAESDQEEPTFPLRFAL